MFCEPHKRTFVSGESAVSLSMPPPHHSHRDRYPGQIPALVSFLHLADGLYSPKCSTVVESKYSPVRINSFFITNKSKIINVGTSHPELAEIIARR